MEVWISGNRIILGKDDFKAAGGEGSVYTKGGLAYKIYTDPKKMIPYKKINELGKIELRNILKPLDVLKDKGMNPVGFTMLDVQSSFVLCQLFPKSFRQREGLTDEKVRKLVQKLYIGTEHIHSKGMLVVDFNEMNFLVAPDFSEVYFIDVDSYQTPSFPATAIMDNIRDRHSKVFSAETDWFSYGVISFMLFTGIHPYKGKHPTLKGMDERMERDVSVLSKDVSVPAATLPFSVIPKNYLEWYAAIFDKGQRIAPPVSFDAATAQVPKYSVVKSTDKLEVTLVNEYPEEVLDMLQSIVLTTGGYYTGKKKLGPIGANLIYVDGEICSIQRVRDRIILPTKTQTGNDTCSTFFVASGRAYTVCNNSIMEYVFLPSANRTMVAQKAVGNILPNSAQIFDSVVIQNLLGSVFATVFPAVGMPEQIKLRDLDGSRIVDAKYSRGVLVVIAERNSRFDRYIFRIKDGKYDVRRVKDVNLGINFAVLPNGCTVLVVDDDLEVFSSDPGYSTLKMIENAGVGNLKLVATDRLYGLVDNKVYRVSMKGK